MNARTKDRSSGYTDVARAYAEQVVAGEILAFRWVQRACQRQLDDLAKFKGKASPYLFNPKLTDKDGRSFQPADNLCAFIERLRHAELVKQSLLGRQVPSKYAPSGRFFVLAHHKTYQRPWCLAQRRPRYLRHRLGARRCDVWLNPVTGWPSAARNTLL